MNEAILTGDRREPLWAPGEVKAGGEVRNYRDNLIPATTTCAQDWVVIDFVPAPLLALSLLSWRR
jgi:hypothetical protein